MLAMLVLLQVLSESGKRLSELRVEVEPYAASGEINFRIEHPDAAFKAVEDTFSDADIDRLDGLTVAWPDRWFNLRSSNTEPLIRLNAEAPDAAGVDELVGRVRSVLMEVS
jgi:phosphomannomutase